MSKNKKNRITQSKDIGEIKTAQDAIRALDGTLKNSILVLERYNNILNKIK